ncbi:hypothetical protein BDY19DRAFT_421662 [Irpex rosettiformis]|uniref:Uncharacterized protein n=1 Tax=Irpex rosettiformis TaxID=378272 RepID=A0ACB8UG76_9APHY|nr:hypothetical protein BDY19DRAFT_421662 [Irpex rosettiformis]
MDDSDDYFDDLVLDEGTIAALDEAETQFAAAQPPPAAPYLPAAKKVENRPAKRQKIEHGPAVPLKRQLSTNDYDNLPEISVQGDSYYQVNVPLASQRSGVVYRASDTQHRTSRPLQARSSSSASIGPNAAPRPSQQPNRRAPGTVISPTHAQPVPNPSGPRTPQSDSVNQKARRDAEILRVKMEELEKNQAELQRKLQEAEDARYTREGEITILRASITRTNEQHAGEVAKLQAAREAAEAAKLQLQKDQREELERLKTHYTFRQHEFETSARKPPWSVSKKAQRIEPNTPVKMPSQMRNWNTGSGSDLVFAETPRGPRFGAIERPASQRLRRPTAFVELNKKKAALPGFHNSFFDTPSRSFSQRTGDKGKGKQRSSLMNDNPFLTSHSGSSPPSSPLAAHHGPLQEDTMEFAGPSNLSPPPSKSLPPVEEADDVEMNMGDNDAEMQEEIEDFDPPSWRAELHHVVFTHTLPPSNMPTMQTLLNASFQLNAPPEQCNMYSTICSRLLEKLGSAPLPITWEDHLLEVANLFAGLARILNETVTLYPLSSLFGLLRILAYTIPLFTAAFLTSAPNNASPPILITLCDTIVTHLAVSNKDKPSEDFATLAKELLPFIEALALTAPAELVPQLSILIRGPKILSTLLDPAQPAWLVAHTARTLGILASYGNLFRALITHPLPIPNENAESTRDISVLPHIEALSWALVDPARDGPGADQLRDQIVTFIAILALSHADALAVLLQSQMLIPSIIMYLSNETEGFWEDDEALISSPPRLNRVLQLISRTIALLYYMVFFSSEPYRLNRRLHYIPSRHFHGIGHIFNVTMGRFSFADSPCWLSDADRACYEQTVDMAKDLLELVVEGPELEDVWKAFQPDNETDQNGDDDEEREACLLHPDSDD